MLLGLAVLAGCAEKQPAWQRPVLPVAPHSIERTNDRAVATAVTPVNSLPLDGMVGQVNGHAIYANTVLKDLEPTFERLSQSERPRVFRELAREAIIRRLNTIVTERLFIAEAERDLNAQEMAYLRHLVYERRKELLRKLGGGSVMVAEEEAKRRYDKTLDEMLEDYRSELLVSRLMALKIDPKIHIRRKDVEKYYHENAAEFNAPPKRTLRLILAHSGMADEIERELKAGKPFIEIASNPRYNARQPEKGGIYVEDEAGEVFFNDDAINKAVLALREGEHTGRVTIGGQPAWVYVDKLTEPVNKSLREAQLEIEQILFRQQKQRLTLQYREELLARGSYTSIEEMTDRVLAIVIARYTRNEAVAGQ